MPPLNVCVSTCDSAFPSGSQPGGNPNAVRVDASGDVYTANAGFGTISKYSPSGAFLCDLAEHINTPQAVEIDDSASEVYFTDWQGNLFTVGMACQANPADCSSGCNKVAVGTMVYGATDVTQGGLIKAGSVFYISAYWQDAVIKYDSVSGTAAECYTGVDEARGLLIDGPNNDL